MSKGLHKLASLVNRLSNKQLTAIVICFIILFLVAQLFIIPWQTSFTIKWNGHSVPIHLGNHPIWDPPLELKIGEKVYDIKPIVDTKELFGRLNYLIWFFTAIIILHIKLRKTIN